MKNTCLLGAMGAPVDPQNDFSESRSFFEKNKTLIYFAAAAAIIYVLNK